VDKLSGTQIGAIAENHVANMLIITTGGRLSEFQRVADDDGIDLLIYEKRSGRALPPQVKCRTVAINRLEAPRDPTRFNSNWQPHVSRTPRLRNFRPVD
jgi:hypothetical protein